MARAKSVNAFRLDVSKLPVLGEVSGEGKDKKVTSPNGIVAIKTTTKTPAGEKDVTHYLLTSDQGLTSFLNSAFGHLPEKDKDGNPVRAEVMKNFIRTSVSRMANGLLDLEIRTANGDPLKTYISGAEKAIKARAAAGDKKAQDILNLAADEENKENLKLYDAKIRAYAEKMKALEVE